MSLKSDAKFEENLAFGSKNNMSFLANFNASSGKSENLNFDVLLLSKVYYVWARKSMQMTLTEFKFDWRSKKTLNELWIHKWHEEFAEFHRSTQKS